MKLTTRGRYGIKAAAEIAAGYKTQKRTSLKDISQKTGISENYLEHIIAPLKKAGIVKSVRGAGGGYTLREPPENIKLGDILRALEGDLAPSDCLTDVGITCGGLDCAECETLPILRRLYDSVNEVVDSVTLDTLINEVKQNE
jgi:Rrf2 family protein